MTGTPLACLLAIILLSCPVRALGQDRLSYSGSEVFRFALHTHGLEPIPAEDVEQFEHQPQNTVVIILGDTSNLPWPLTGNRLRNFVHRDGSLLIATDTPSPAIRRGNEPGWGAAFNIRVTGQHLEARELRDNYRRVRGRPFIKPWPVPPGGPDLFEQVPEGGPNGIATDHPSEMTLGIQIGFTPFALAGYPPGTQRIDDNKLIEKSNNHFAVTLLPWGNRGGVGNGRMMVLADHSVFVNGMMGFKETADGDYEFDNGNWAFANRTIEWLQGGGGDGPRSRCLFVEDGRVIDRFAIERPAVPRPPVPDIPPDVLANILLNHSNGVIRELEEKNFFNRVLEGWLGFPRILRLFLILATALFAFVALRWFMRAYRKPESAARLSPDVRDGLLPRGGVLRQRTAAQMDVGNLYEAARRRVRERFDILGGRPPSEGSIPPILLASDVADGPALQRAIRWLWEIGYGDQPVPVPPMEWDRLNGVLERVTARAARGDWSFGAEVS